MSKERLKVLVLDDEVRVREELKEFLLNSGFIVHTAGLPSEGLKILKDNDIDIMILDVKMPEMDGLEVLRRVKKDHPEVEVIMISGHGDMSTVIEAMRNKATDYFTKPFRLAEVQGAIERTRRFIELNKKIIELETGFNLLSLELRERVGHTIIGQSKGMRQVVDLMGKVALTNDTSVLLTGESGTGKEVISRGIHHLSSRKDHYFHSVNCSAIPKELFESEFFGHTKGAYTGATETKAGWFEIADKGTLFLDEIVDMDPGLQSKFLRVLEEKQVTRVGSTKELKVDVRIIAATNQNIDKMVDEGKFRVDLFHRLNIFHIHIPPLRERKDDIPMLFDFFVNKFSKSQGGVGVEVDPLIYEQLMSYHFPGNVRELRNIAERAMILSGWKKIKPEHLNMPGQLNKLAPKVEALAFNTYDLEEMEVQLIKKVLEETDNNKSQAARLLNISWQALDRRLKKLNIILDD